MMTKTVTADIATAEVDSFYKGSERLSNRSSPWATSEAPYEAVLGQMVTIREGGVERQVSATEAFFLQHSKRGLEGDGAATRTTLAVIEYVKERPSADQGFIRIIVRLIVAPGSVTSALSRCEWPRNLIPTARPHGWPSNRGSSRPR